MADDFLLATINLRDFQQAGHEQHYSLPIGKENFTILYDASFCSTRAWTVYVPGHRVVATETGKNKDGHKLHLKLVSGSGTVKPSQHAREHFGKAFSGLPALGYTADHKVTSVAVSYNGLCPRAQYKAEYQLFPLSGGGQSSDTKLGSLFVVDAKDSKADAEDSKDAKPDIQAFIRAVSVENKCKRESFRIGSKICPVM
eukprot:CAMPEP_0170168588 /NCGR_PEP_ID=MMETSP0040_2-20121228/1569_1 /TAXON_ID=641309 /ORGANISM="Lotharella oceanica, Strain CCMP622" /LENGTH=198 /DNA_ID=CAMNT_0010406863 /DNA_START=96 /DNA_END=692 /DNA_ORIENTATION=+